MRKKRVTNLFKAMWSYTTRQTSLPSWPQISSIEITNDCNLNCCFCARTAVYQNRGIGYMSLDQYKFIVDNYSLQLQEPRLFLHGEPTIHPHLVEMIRLTKEAGANSVGFTTNGVLLDDELFLKCVDAGLTVVAFSFEGTSQEAYETLRGKHFDRVQQNILDCCKLNHRLQLGINISINIIDCKLTHKDLHNFRNKWCKVKGLTGEVTVSQLGDWVGAVNVDDLATDRPKRYKPVSVCPASWYLVDIYWNGGIAPCCTWVNKPFGNIFKDDLLKVWNSREYIEFREIMLKGRTNHPYCQNCRANPFPPDSPYLKPKMLDMFVFNPIKRRLK